MHNLNYQNKKEGGGRRGEHYIEIIAETKSVWFSFREKFVYHETTSLSLFFFLRLSEQKTAGIFQQHFLDIH